MIAIEITLGFAEWMDLNCVRNNEHEWKYRGDKYSKVYSTKEMFEIYTDEISTYKG